MKAEDIFPAEIWHKIFRELDDPKDRISAKNASPFFWNALKGDKVAMLLPGVLDILEKCRKPTSTYIRMLDISSVDIMQCRLVSKSWKRTIDSWTSNHPSTRNLIMYPGLTDAAYFNMYFNTAIPLIIDVDQPNDSVKTDRILECWENLEENKRDFIIPSRHLMVKNLPFLEVEEKYGDAWREWIVEAHEHEQEVDQEEEDHDDEFEDVHFLLRLLKTIGPTILHFSLETSDEISNPDAKYEWLRNLIQCLELMPNLKSLFIQQPNVDEFNACICDINNFPHFPNLEVVQCDWLYGRIIRSLALSNPQIKKLSINRYETAGKMKKFLKAIKLENLSEFSFCTGASGTWNDQMESLKYINWPLTKLSLLFGQGEDAIPAEMLFQGLEQFEGSLTHLRVKYMKRPRNGVIWVNTNLPKLRYLRLFIAGPLKKKLQIEYMQHVDKKIDCKIIVS